MILVSYILENQMIPAAAAHMRHIDYYQDNTTTCLTTYIKLPYDYVSYIAYSNFLTQF